MEARVKGATGLELILREESDAKELHSPQFEIVQWKKFGEKDGCYTIVQFVQNSDNTFDILSPTERIVSKEVNTEELWTLIRLGFNILNTLYF